MKRSWSEWRYLSTSGASSHLTMMTLRRCAVTSRRPAASGRGSHAFSGQRTRLPVYAACSTRPLFNLFSFFGSETWILAPATIKRLEGFQVKATRRMTGLLPKMTGGTWKYPKTKAVLKAAGLHTIEHYVRVRRARIMRWVIDRPILNLCRSAERRRGTTPRLHLWEQPVELDDASRGGCPRL